MNIARLILLGLCLLPSAGAAPVSAAPIELVEAKDTGIAFVHSDGSAGRRYIVETVASGLATFDFDNDGLIDVYFLTGTPLRGTDVSVFPDNRLYRNLGGFRFEDVTDRSGTGRGGYGLAVAAADFDNDGWTDLYLSNLGRNALFRNRGDGRFADVAETAGVASDDPTRVGAGTVFLDADGDGRLDLFAANYLEFSYERHQPRIRRGKEIYRGPEFYPPRASHFWLNAGDGKFVDASKTSGIGARKSWGMGTVACDYDLDGDTDLFVANDSAANFLWNNNGQGRFEEVGVESGVAYDYNGDAHGNMCVETGDYDNDGLPDFYVTSYQTQLATLFRNLGGGLFQDVTLESRAGSGTRPHVTWGSGLVDFDNDGFRDLFVACGHLMDNIDEIDDSTSYLARPILLRNRGDGRFENVTDQAGPGLKSKSVGRGAAFEDLDNDGDVDVVVLNSRRPPTILRNTLSERRSAAHWLQVRLQGLKSNRDGVGARVTVVAQDARWVDEVHSGRSYQSHFGTRLHFGLGPRTQVDRIEVHWIGGGVDLLENVAVNQCVTIVENQPQMEP